MPASTDGWAPDIGTIMRPGYPIERCGETDAVLEVRREEVHVADVSAVEASRIDVVAEIEGWWGFAFRWPAFANLPFINILCE
jgi:hypothetical protein